MALTRLNNNAIGETLSVAKGGTGVTTGAGLTLISSQTVSTAVASVSFTSGIDSTYDEYVIKFFGIAPSSNGVNFEMNFSTDGGSNYNVTKTTNQFEAYQNESGSSANLRYDANNRDLAQSTSFQRITGEMPQNSGEEDSSASGIIRLYDAASTTLVKQFNTDVNYAADGTSLYAWRLFTSGYLNTTSAIDAVKFKFNSGNIRVGTITLYGVRS